MGYSIVVGYNQFLVGIQKYLCNLDLPGVCSFIELGWLVVLF